MAEGIQAEIVGSPKKEEILINSPASERICVGAPLRNNDLFYEFEDDFPEDAFTVPIWKAIFRLEKYLHNNGYKIDKNTIINCADKVPEVANLLMEIGGIEMIDRAMNYPDDMNFSQHIKNVRNAYEKRVIIETKKRELVQLESMAVDAEVGSKDLVDVVDKNSIEIAAKVSGVDDYQVTIIDPNSFLRKAEKEKSEGKTFKGIRTNMHHWDEMLGGLANGRLYIMGAPTGCGKSFLNISMATSAAYGQMPGDPQSKHLIIDTGELIYEDDFLPRLISNMSGVFINKIANNSWQDHPMDKERVLTALKKMNDNPIYWKQMPDFDGPSVRNLIRRMRHKVGIDCVWFDNIKINPRWQGKDVYTKIGDLAQYLKDAAVEVGIPVFAFIQLTNDGSVVGRKKLGMQDAHVDMFAGGRRTLQNADLGMIMDYLDPDDPYNDNRKLIIQKSRNNRWHRKGERFVLTGDLRRGSLIITDNELLKPLDAHIEGTASLGGSVINVNSNYLNKSVKINNDDNAPLGINLEDIPDFD